MAEPEVWAAKPADVAGLPVGRVLPRRTRRTVGAWCFVDHMGPATLDAEATFDIAPHPHIGLQTPSRGASPARPCIATASARNNRSAPVSST